MVSVIGPLGQANLRTVIRNLFQSFHGPQVLWETVTRVDWRSTEVPARHTLTVFESASSASSPPWALFFILVGKVVWMSVCLLVYLPVGLCERREVVERLGWGLVIKILQHCKCLSSFGVHALRQSPFLSLLQFSQLYGSTVVSWEQDRNHYPARAQQCCVVEY